MLNTMLIIGDIDLLGSVFVKFAAVALPVGFMIIVLGLAYWVAISMLRSTWAHRSQILDCLSFLLLPFLRLCDWAADL